jgi:hypothetical protein
MKQTAVSFGAAVAVSLACVGCANESAGEIPAAQPGGSAIDAAGSVDAVAGGSDARVDGEMADAAGSTLDPSPACTAVPIQGDRTSSALPPPPAAGADVSFLTDWARIPAGGGFNRTQIMDPCRIHPDGQTAHSMPAVRVEVRPGDDPLALGANSERAEVLTMQNASGTIQETAASGTQYYATSYFFPTTWDGTFLRGNSNSWSFVMQFHGTGSALPGGLTAGRHTVGGPQIYQLQGVGQTYDLSNGTISLGRWTDFVFVYAWAATATGHITVFRRDQGQPKFTQVLDVANVVTMPSATESYYWKQGLYRGGDVGTRIDVFWMGPTARAASFAAAEMAAFGTSKGF